MDTGELNHLSVLILLFLSEPTCTLTIFLFVKQLFPHQSNVPWQWVGNRPLARWVNAQRKKYMDMERGKKSNLTPDQIRRLEEIGFRWSTEGKGRYGENALVL